VESFVCDKTESGVKVINLVRASMKDIMNYFIKLYLINGLRKINEKIEK